MNSRLRVAVAATGLAFVFAILLGATGVLAPKSQRVALGASTTLTIISGPIFVQHPGRDFAPADDGVVLGPGDTVKTGADARAVLTYFEGSTVEIEPDSELVIDAAHSNPDGSTVIVMQQNLGATWHVVTHLVQGGSRYEVHTTTATASVRGTQFQVGVNAELSTTVTTTEGDVATSDPGATTTVEVTQGLQTTTKKGEAPQAPKPAPQPERKVTVTVTDPNALVVDPLGRANGVKDGKTVIQTPGAQVKLVNGQLVVTMPNMPDGEVATHFVNTSAPGHDVDVSTKVEDKGTDAVEVKNTVKRTSTTVTGVDVKTSTTHGKPTVEVKKPTDAKKPKVGEAPPTPSDEPAKSVDANATPSTANAKPSDSDKDTAGPTGSSGATGASGQGTGGRTNTTANPTNPTVNTTNTAATTKDGRANGQPPGGSAGSGSGAGTSGPNSGSSKSSGSSGTTVSAFIPRIAPPRLPPMRAQIPARTLNDTSGDNAGK